MDYLRIAEIGGPGGIHSVTTKTKAHQSKRTNSGGENCGDGSKFDCK